MGNDGEMESEFIKPIFIQPKGNTVKFVIDARCLNSVTDLSRYDLLNLLERLWLDFGENISQRVICSTYNQVLLTEEIKQLLSSVIEPLPNSTYLPTYYHKEK